MYWSRPVQLIQLDVKDEITKKITYEAHEKIWKKILLKKKEKSMILK